MNTIVSLVQFATSKRIIRLVAKECAKYVAKKPKTKKKDGNQPHKQEEPFKNDDLYKALRTMTPPHKLWSDPGRGRLPRDADSGPARWSKRKNNATARIYWAIIKNKDKYPDSGWAVEIKRFVKDIQDIISGSAPLTLETPQIIAKFKEQDPDTGDYIYRPICKYKDLKTKIILALAYQYLVTGFDRFFHKDMLFMRTARPDQWGQFKVPNYLDAIDMVSAYREEHFRESIWVGECDIQKFYDIFNHDVIRESFQDLFRTARSNGAKGVDFSPMERIIDAYLESYNFPRDIMGKNADPSFWAAHVRMWKKKMAISDDDTPPVCRFKWVKDDAFVSTSCYTPEQFAVARDGGKLGIPQGGALSGIIVNVVMRMVDKPIVEKADPDRLFIRYCDDILLMHTSHSKCREYLETYYNQLLRYRLVPHPRKDVSSFKKGKKGRKTDKAFWKAKSKNVYYWGPGAGDASDWVPFVGYEMRRTGEIRIRKDKMDAEFKRIAKRYWDVYYSKTALAGSAASAEDKQKQMERFDKLPPHILNYEMAFNNRYTRSQAIVLDNYLYRKARKAAWHLGIADTKKAAKERATYLDALKNKLSSLSGLNQTSCV